MNSPIAAVEDVKGVGSSFFALSSSAQVPSRSSAIKCPVGGLLFH
jgi:hypothetical protein